MLGPSNAKENDARTLFIYVLYALFIYLCGFLYVEPSWESLLHVIQMRVWVCPSVKNIVQEVQEVGPNTHHTEVR